MAELPEEVRDTTDALDALGNTTAATGKGFAIGSALLITLALVSAYTEENVNEETGETLKLDMTDAATLAGGLVGAMLPFLFAAMTMFAVETAAGALIIEVRRQFRDTPGLREGAHGVEPDSQRCVAICTNAAIREMVAPGVIAVLAPLCFGFIFGAEFLGGMLIGSIFSGFFLGTTMANAGGAWDNAKKFCERGALGEGKLKGSEAHKAVVVGDTVGDPFKDTSGPALNILSKLMSLLALLISGQLGFGFDKYEDGLAVLAVSIIIGLSLYIWYMKSIAAEQKARDVLDAASQMKEVPSLVTDDDFKTS
jgi:H(+)-translocating pyrophosphatase